MRDLFLIALAVGYPVLALWQLYARKLRDRADVVIVLVTGVLFLLVVRATADWNALPAWLWLVGLALMAGATALAGWRWAELSWAKSARRGASTVVQLLLAGAFCAVLL
ncbi:hypothetical protein [Kribbella sp. NPDC051770]|uniref:hypothetical protein n=1 Tax=Kribbella sp. NPDC051770 TaxID=3155413 RepID=UPI0034316664